MSSAIDYQISQNKYENVINVTDEMLTTTDSSTNSTYEKNILATSALIEDIYIIIATFGLVGNSLVILVFLSAPNLRKKITCMFLINQSCVDATVSLLMIMNSWLSSDIPFSGLTGVIYCKLWQSRMLLWGWFISSTYNLVVLSFERYVAIVHPFVHATAFTRKKAAVVIIALWILGPIIEGAVTVPTTHVVSGICSLYSNWPNQTAKFVYGIAVLIIKLLLPLFLLTYAYGRIAITLHNKAKSKKALAQLNNKQYRKGRGNTIKTLLIVSVCFFLCWTWNSIIYSGSYMGVKNDFSSDFYHFSIIAVYINCCINPFIYAVKYEQFQRAAYRLYKRTLGFTNSRKATHGNSSINTSQVTNSTEL